MSLPRIVCPYSPALLQSFHGRSVAVRVNDAVRASEAADEVARSGNELFCVIVESSIPLQDIELAEDLRRTPLAIMAPSMGRFRDASAKITAWRGFNLRIYLACDGPENRTALKILSSLGVQTCALFGSGLDDWEGLSDLMTYAVLGLFPHAPIDPFSYIAKNYQAGDYLDWGSLYFDDPKQFLHLDIDGRVALSRAEREAGHFIASCLAECDAVPGPPAIRERTRAWTKYFLDNHLCSQCPGWKVCLGKFSANETCGCSEFFAAMVEVSQRYQRLKAPPSETHVWRP
jgi:hypothetical protein